MFIKHRPVDPHQISFSLFNEISQRAVAPRAVQAEKSRGLEQAAAGIIFVIAILDGLIGLRVLLKLISTNPENDVAAMIFHLTAPFVSPFLGLTINPTAEFSILELTSIIALIAYALFGWAVRDLIGLFSSRQID
jgi:hypothetical protein